MFEPARRLEYGNSEKASLQLASRFSTPPATRKRIWAPSISTPVARTDPLTARDCRSAGRSTGLAMGLGTRSFLLGSSPLEDQTSELVHQARICAQDRERATPFKPQRRKFPGVREEAHA